MTLLTSRPLRPALLALGLCVGLLDAVVAQSANPSVAKPLRPIFVLNSQDANISVLDPNTYSEVKRIAVGKEPHHLYLTPDEKSLLVANAVGDTLTFIDPATGQVQRTITNNDAPTTPSNDRDRPVLQVIVGSTRPGRIGRSFAEWIERAATDHGDFTVEMVDLADVALPFLDEPNHPRLAQYTHQHTRDWSATISRADAFE